jgi:hypothetical protein
VGEAPWYFPVFLPGGVALVPNEHDLAVDQRQNGGASLTGSGYCAYVRSHVAVAEPHRVPQQHGIAVLVHDPRAHLPLKLVVKNDLERRSMRIDE